MNQKIERIKNHLVENKKVYIAAVAGAVMGGIVVLMIIKYRRLPSEINVTRILSPGDENIMKVFINPLGDPGNVVQCVETGTVYASQGQAARELGVTATNIGNHLHGKISDIKGLHFIILGKAGQVLAE